MNGKETEKTAGQNQTELQELKPQEEKTFMTIKKLAEVLGVTERTVKNAARAKGVEGTFSPLQTNGGTQAARVYNEEEATAIKQEIQKHHNLASRQIDTATTRLEVLANYKAATQAMIELLEAEKAELQAENERQAAKIKEDAPKVEFYNAVTDSTDCIDIGQAAKVLNVKGVGRNKLFEILRKEGVLDRKNMPYQKFVDAGLFRVIETSFTLPDGTQKINLKTLVFQKGLDFIREILQGEKKK